MQVFDLGAVVDIERHSACEALYAVDVELLFRYHFGHDRDVLCRQAASEQRYDPAVFALKAHPLLVFGYADRGEAYFYVEFVGFEKQILENLTGYRTVGAEQYAEREGVVDVGLAYVEYAGVVAGEDFGQGRGHAWTVDT